MSENYKCVITPNVRKMRMKSIKLTVRPGEHEVVDFTVDPPTVTTYSRDGKLLRKRKCRA